MFIIPEVNTDGAQRVNKVLLVSLTFLLSPVFFWDPFGNIRQKRFNSSPSTELFHFIF